MRWPVSLPVQWCPPILRQAIHKHNDRCRQTAAAMIGREGPRTQPIMSWLLVQRLEIAIDLGTHIENQADRAETDLAQIEPGTDAQIDQARLINELNARRRQLRTHVLAWCDHLARCLATFQNFDAESRERAAFIIDAFGRCKR